MPTNLFITNTANSNLGQRLRELISTSREMRATEGMTELLKIQLIL